MINRIIQLAKAGYEINFASDPTGIQFSLRIGVARDGFSVKKMILFDELKMSVLPAEVIIMSHIEQLVGEVDRTLDEDFKDFKGE